VRGAKALAHRRRRFLPKEKDESYLLIDKSHATL